MRTEALLLTMADIDRHLEAVARAFEVAHEAANKLLRQSREALQCVLDDDASAPVYDRLNPQQIEQIERMIARIDVCLTEIRGGTLQ